jgi:hypothetical protein
MVKLEGDRVQVRVCEGRGMNMYVYGWRGWRGGHGKIWGRTGDQDGGSLHTTGCCRRIG